MLWLGIFGLGGKGVLLLERITPQYIFETIAKETVTYAFLLLPWAQDILGALDRSEIRKEDHDLSCWRKMNMGAQPIPASVIKRWKEYFPYMEYETECGLTESGGPGMIHLGFGNEHKAGSVGKPGMLWDARIVNDKGEEVTPGEVGELIVKGNGVMKEYYKNPELTAQTIRNGWLHTGDMAKVDNDGFIYLVDRKKDIVIVGGENIYPVEIENVIRKHPKIYDVAVIGIPDDRLGEILAVVIDPKPGETLSEEEVNSFCEQSFPRYKRPRRIIFDKVPRNPTGKIEKPKLREKYA